MFYLMQVGVRPGIEYIKTSSRSLFDTYEEAAYVCMELNSYLEKADAPFRWCVSRTV